MSKRPKNLDLNQLAKRIVDEAIGEIKPEEIIDENKKDADEKKRLNELESSNKKLDS